MDYDSSTKFISSLAKFLQSLCNGYVEFDNGVQVIGHLYLSVDTGKTIDYILNEKVCKTDENSVTFISNSFHAQPAERPKPQGKKTVDKGETKSEDVNDILGGQTEPKSTNYGTLPPRGTQNSPHSQNLKRSFSPSSKQPRGDGSPSKLGRSSPRNKKSRTESVDHNLSQVSNPASENSISSQPSPAADVGAPPTVSAQSADASQTTPYNETYQQSFFQPGDDENSMADDTEERDIKPSIDTDVTFIKEEFGTSSCSQSGNQNRDRGHGDDSSVYPSMYHSNQTFSTTNFQTGFASTPSSSHRSNFNASGDNRSSLYTSGSSQLDTGESSGDPSAYDVNTSQRMAAHFAHQEVNKSWGYKCDNCGKVYTLSHVLSRHKWKCKGLREILCQICNAKFYRMDHLKKHMFRHGAVEQWFPNAGSRTTGTSNSWPSLDSSAIEKSEPRNNKNKREKVTS